MTQIFISYSRKDKEFIKKLHGELSKRNFDVWVDWEDIPPVSDWRQEIYTGIEETLNFAFIISPDSVASKVCGEELEYAIKNNKRLIPILYRDVEPQLVNPTLAALNWIFMREIDDFNTSIETLIKGINVDLKYIEKHTQLLKQAIEWDKKGRDKSFLLRGTSLEEA
ncbi:MAG TPA: toll/interleukin-1 receptor domain-containing protein, partial [Allocoleopsis sp.]